MNRLRQDMYACGQAGLPKVIFCLGKQWQLDTLFKHDFFACTGCYLNKETGKKVVLKFSRLRSFLGFPLAWIGRFLRNREMKILLQLKGIEQVPSIIKPYGRNGLIYHYIEGKSLDEKPDIPNEYFDKLQTLLDKIHQCHICYMDMNKRGNILLGDDGEPYIIDFQISLFLPGKWSDRLRQIFQREDNYHLLKHKRKLRPDLLSEQEHQNAKRTSLLIRIHRSIAGPFQKVRRLILRFMYKKKILHADSTSDRSPENNPDRFLK